MDAADRVFIREGYDGATIRAIAAEAGSGLARFNKHWPDKEALFHDVFSRHFRPIHQAQEARLDALVAEGGEAYQDASRVIEAFLAPALVGNIESVDKNTGHLVYCRALSDPAPESRRIVEALVSESFPRVVTMLRTALPMADEATFFLIVATVTGAYIEPQLFGRNLAAAMGVSFEHVDWSKAAGTIARILVSGLNIFARRPAG